MQYRRTKAKRCQLKHDLVDELLELIIPSSLPPATQKYIRSANLWDVKLDALEDIKEYFSSPERWVPLDDPDRPRLLATNQTQAPKRAGYGPRVITTLRSWDEFLAENTSLDEEISRDDGRESVQPGIREDEK